MHIPIVDFSKCGILHEDVGPTEFFESGKQLHEAFRSAGFVYISGSGITRSMVDRVNEVSEAFFNQSIDRKMKFSNRDLEVMCYDRFGSLNMNSNRPFDHQEGFRVATYDELCDWPDVPNFKGTIQEFKHVCRRLLLRILMALGTGMKLKQPDHFANSHQRLNQKGNPTVVKLIYYPPVTDETKPEPKQMRIAEHSDFGSITLLFHDEIGGLQVQTPDGEFIDAPYIPETILLNVGDMLQFWTGGRLKSTIHRVVFPTDPAKRSVPRKSITYFGTVDNEVLLSELEFEGSETPPKNDSAPITSEEYTRRRFNATYAH